MTGIATTGLKAETECGVLTVGITLSDDGMIIVHWIEDMQVQLMGRPSNRHWVPGENPLPFMLTDKEGEKDIPSWENPFAVR